MIFGVVLLHVWALHVSGSNNPTGIEPKGKQDTLPFHPYYTAKDTFGLSIFLIIYAAITFYAPNIFAHPDHFIEYNPMQTPPHIVPEWYFLPFYAILRAVTFDIGIPFTDIVFVPAKLGGVLAMFGAVIVLFFLPWLDTHEVKAPVTARNSSLHYCFLWSILLFLAGSAWKRPMPSCLRSAALMCRCSGWDSLVRFIISHFSLLYCHGFPVRKEPCLCRKALMKQCCKKRKRRKRGGKNECTE